MADLRPVASLTFHIGSHGYVFVPEKARPADMPHLLLLFMALSVNGRVGPFDAEGFVTVHSLWHCLMRA